MESRVSADIAAPRGIALNQGLTGLAGLTVTAALPLQKQHSTAKAKKTDIVCFENVIKCKFEINKCGVRCGNAMSGFTKFPSFSRYIGCSLTRVQTCLERNGVERFR